VIKILTLLTNPVDAEENFTRLEGFLNNETLLKGVFTFKSLTFNSAVTNEAYPHGLKYTPLDILQLSVTNGATVTWHYDSFDATNIYLTTSAACTIRCFIGRYED